MVLDGVTDAGSGVDGDNRNRGEEETIETDSGLGEVQGNGNFVARLHVRSRISKWIVVRIINTIHFQVGIHDPSKIAGPTRVHKRGHVDGIRGPAQTPVLRSQSGAFNKN